MTRDRRRARDRVLRLVSALLRACSVTSQSRTGFDSALAWVLSVRRQLPQFAASRVKGVLRHRPNGQLCAQRELILYLLLLGDAAGSSRGFCDALCARSA